MQVEVFENVEYFNDDKPTQTKDIYSSLQEMANAILPMISPKK